MIIIKPQTNSSIITCAQYNFVDVYPIFKHECSYTTGTSHPSTTPGVGKVVSRHFIENAGRYAENDDNSHMTNMEPWKPQH